MQLFNGLVLKKLKSFFAFERHNFSRLSSWDVMCRQISRRIARHRLKLLFNRWSIRYALCNWFRWLNFWNKLRHALDCGWFIAFYLILNFDWPLFGLLLDVDLIKHHAFFGFPIMVHGFWVSNSCLLTHVHIRLTAVNSFTSCHVTTTIWASVHHSCTSLH